MYLLLFYLYITFSLSLAIYIYRTAIGIKCTDGVVIAVEKPQMSKMLVAGSNRRVFGVDSHCGITITGFAADGRQIVHRAREESTSYKETYGQKIIPSVLANRYSIFLFVKLIFYYYFILIILCRLALYVHYFTIHGSLRPFGATALFAAYDEDIKSPELYMIEPSGLSFRYFGCAAGKGANAAKTEIEKILNKRGDAGLTCAEAVEELAYILYTIRDHSKDKPFEIEMGWLTAANDFKHKLVPSEIVSAAETKAKATLSGEDVIPAELAAMDI